MVYITILLKLKIKIAKFGKDVVQMELLCPVAVQIQIFGRIVFYYPMKLNKYLPFPPETPLLILCNRHDHIYAPKDMH